MLLLRFYLIGGMLLHKALWEALWHRSAARSMKAVRVRSIIVKGVKQCLLLAIMLQTLFVDGPATDFEPERIRAIGIVLYTVGLMTAILARWQLGQNWSDIENATVLRTQAVVSHGIYRFIRHPIYVGDLLLLIGLELSLLSWFVMPIIMLAPAVLWQAVREEKMLVHALPGYGDYCLRSKRFIPFVV
jgi:protein-S-isoprenylcysteine O-methyltransferase Ste14